MGPGARASSSIPSCRRPADRPTPPRRRCRPRWPPPARNERRSIRSDIVPPCVSDRSDHLSSVRRISRSSGPTDDVRARAVHLTIALCARDAGSTPTGRPVGAPRPAWSVGDARPAGLGPVLFSCALGDRGVPAVGGRPLAGLGAGLLPPMPSGSPSGPAGPGPRARPTSTGSCSGATWPSWPPGGTRGPPSPGPRPRFGPTSTGLPGGAWSAERPVGPAVARRRPTPGCPGSSATASCDDLLEPADGARQACPPEVDRRDDAVLELLYGCGLRVAELCGLDVGDVDLARRVVTVTGQGLQAAPGAHPRAVRRGRRGPGWTAPRAAMLTASRKPSRRRSSSTAGASGSGPGTSGGSSTAARRCPPTPTPCATASPPTCSTGAPTCGSSRNCWATPVLQTTQVYTHVSKERLLAVYREPIPRA